MGFVGTAHPLSVGGVGKVSSCPSLVPCTLSKAMAGDPEVCAK